MFKKTRFRLVLLYTLVFFILLNLFSASLYITTQQRLFKQVDEEMHRELQLIQRLANRERDREFFYRPARLMSAIYWDEEKKLMRQIPGDLFTAEQLDKFRASVDADEAVTVSLAKEEFRVTTERYLKGYIQLTYNLNPEKKVLSHLLFMMGLGGIVSIAIAVIAGAFLANRALIPITKALEQQKQFVSDASHELRTPLSVLQIHLEQLFRHPERTIEQESRKISIMLNETKRMSKLAAELLDLARSDAEQLKLVCSKIDLREIVLPAAKQFQELSAATAAPVTIETHIDESLELTGDADRLHQLFVILLENAVRFTKEGRITISGEKAGHQIQITVRDTGIGIEQKHLSKIFDRFYRVDPVRNRNDGGLGLGLSIAKTIVEAHRGSIYAESEPNRGTSIHVRLPIS